MSFIKTGLLAFLFLLPLCRLNATGHITNDVIARDTSEVRQLVTEIYYLFDKQDFEKSKPLVEKLEQIFKPESINDKKLLSDAYYAIGTKNLKVLDYKEALRFFKLSKFYREEIPLRDLRYAKCLNNISVVYFNIGDFSNALKYANLALLVKQQLYGPDSRELIPSYVNLASINLQLYNFEDALTFAETGLSVARLYDDSENTSHVADLYQDIALGLYRKGENTKALLYANEALRRYDLSDNSRASSWVTMINTVTLIYLGLNNTEKAEEYYNLGLSHSTAENINDTWSLYIGYASFLSKSKQFDRAEKVLLSAIEIITEGMGKDSRYYSMITASYASVIYQKSRNAAIARDYFNKCFDYLNKYPADLIAKEYVINEYASVLFDAGLYRDAVKVLNKVLAPGDTLTGSAGSALKNANRISEYTTDALSLKFKSLNLLAKETGSRNYTLQAIETGRLLTSILDRNRMEMSEDQSRTNLSDNSRVFYTSLIENYCSLYLTSKYNGYINKAFEYSEKSKMSGFLAATRQMDATNFSIPNDLAEIDTDIREKLGLHGELIAKEKAKENPDSIKISTWEKIVFDLTRSRDSLVRIFEEKYPEYYKIKYNSETTSIDDVTRVLGSGENLLSYVLTDDKLIIFIINRRCKEVLIRDIDPAFHANLARFREIVSTVPSGDNARASFNEYMSLAYELYRVLIEPAEPLLISDRLTISPDNILSYIPFETLITSPFSSDGVLYRDAPYVLKKYRLSYIYSVTLSSERKDINLRLFNKVIAFAPSYDDRELSDSLLIHYPNLRGSITSLPYASDEASDVVRQCGGFAYLGNSATEEVFKREASKFDIIHLAMHTLVNDQEPSYSKMIFSRSASSSEDDMLNTYEVYNTPIDARMIVLSSCNTGSGMLTSGEGIQSLARGFIFSGGNSVVMSMWEVEDYAGSEVIKMFYRNLINGKTKSQALRNARMEFLKKADQQRSHPYYWSTLVVYGDDSSLYFGKYRLISAIVSLVLILSLLFYIFYKNPRS